MRIFIEPTEPLLFRTGRPFAAGIHNFAESLFPPTPETLQGAVRAMIAATWGQNQHPAITHPYELFQQKELVTLIGERTSEGETYGRFRVTGLTLGWRASSEPHVAVARLFPAPAYLIRAKIKDAQQQVHDHIVRLSLTTLQNDEESNLPEGCTALLMPELQGQTIVEKAEPLNGWLTARGLRAALGGEVVQSTMDELHTYEQVYERESRLGIGMDNETKNTKEGYLYQAQMIRMRPGYGFVVDIAFGERNNGTSKMPVKEPLEARPSALRFLQEGWLILGGEQRAARFTILDQEDNPADEIDQSNSGRLLYFATPAYFKRGWLPEMPGLFPIPPVTAAINRYQPIGGWYLDARNAGGESKQIHRCIPAGSVYFFDQSINITHAVTEYGWQIGYGITYTGEWKA
ncbi:MAG TPA: type III-B CRISPR module-associated protein Cmr3 [Ktedonosporobacter sp.]|jgi:CRISPR-associated protein Cmr3|nr:type III-B CRISPR module-associated protein Cmr3 [Ktedonosporobacter sp.]